MDNNNIIIELLYKKYGKLLLTTEETAIELNVSALTLIRNRGNKTGLKYVKTSDATQARVSYSVNAIAEYIKDCHKCSDKEK